jgi:hypothetical protein
MFFHEFGNHLVLALEFGLKRRNTAVLEVQRPLLRVLECSDPVLEELLLPLVKKRGPEMVLVAEI